MVVDRLDMKKRFLLMGIQEGEYLPSVEKENPIALTELELILGWKTYEDPLHDYLLTEEHITAIKKTCLIDLPRNLIFFLTSSG